MVSLFSLSVTSVLCSWLPTSPTVAHVSCCGDHWALELFPPCPFLANHCSIGSSLENLPWPLFKLDPVNPIILYYFLSSANLYATLLCASAYTFLLLLPYQHVSSMRMWIDVNNHLLTSYRALMTDQRGDSTWENGAHLSVGVTQESHISVAFSCTTYM